MSLARQQRAESAPRAAAPYHEPAERDDPRNALLDTMAQQILDLIESAQRNDVLAPLLARIESMAPELNRSLATQIPALAVAAAPCGAPVAPAAGMGRVDTTEAELRLATVLAALKMGMPKTAAARELHDRARMLVLSDLAALRAAGSAIAARRHRDVPKAEPVTFLLEDAGGGA